MSQIKYKGARLHLNDDDYAAIVKRYEDASDSQNADIIRKQWAADRARAIVPAKTNATMLTGLPTSYGLPARIDGMDPDHLRALLPLAVANAGTREAMARLVALDTLSAMLWLYRRLPRAYGRQAHVDVVIERLAGQTGADVAGDLAERGTAPSEQTDNEGKGSSNAN